MPRLRVALLSVAVAMVAACTSASPSAPLWTYGPTIAPPSSPSASPAPSVSAGGNTIGLSEWKVDVASTIKSGKSTFTISNAGTIPHELLVLKSGLEPSAYPTDAVGDIIEDGAGVTLLSDGENVDPGGSQVRTIDLAPGTYLFVCNITGHFKAGMFTVVTVTK